MGLWWLQEGWTDARCPQCGKKIWPEGDPDWGLCFDCFSDRQQAREQYPEPTEAELCASYNHPQYYDYDCCMCGFWWYPDGWPSGLMYDKSAGWR